MKANFSAMKALWSKPVFGIFLVFFFAVVNVKFMRDSYKRELMVMLYRDVPQGSSFNQLYGWMNLHEGRLIKDIPGTVEFLISCDQFKSLNSNHDYFVAITVELDDQNNVLSYGTPSAPQFHRF